MTAAMRVRAADVDDDRVVIDEFDSLRRLEVDQPTRLASELRENEQKEADRQREKQ